MLSDAYLANGSEPWLIPDPDAMPDFGVEFATEPNQDGAFCPTCATRRRWRGRGRFPARPGSSTASAGSRRRT